MTKIVTDLKGASHPGLRPYPKMKVSSVEWLGKIPAHWKILRLKQICRMAYGDALANDIRQDGIVSVFGSNGRVGFHHVANTNAPCIIIGRKGSFGKVNYSQEPVFAIDTTFFVDNRFSDENLRWLFYILTWLRLDGVTKDSAVPGLDREDAYQRFGILPPLSEQAAIVHFLDRVDRSIRHYIRSMEDLIALLDEQKQTIIHRAVTGQFDVRTRGPYPAYRDSGISWLGTVPAHWEVRRLKTWLSINELVLSEDTNPKYKFDYLDIGSVETGRLTVRPERIQFGNSPSRARRVVRSGDTIVSTVRTYLKAVWHAEHLGADLIVSTGFAVLTPRSGAYPRFVSYLCQSDAFTNRVTAESVGIAYPAIAETRLGTFEVCIPSVSEQVAIAHFLDCTTANISAAVDKGRRKIEFMHEWRTRLIADVVTGNLDVREVATPLLEVITADLSGTADAVTRVKFTTSDTAKEVGL